MSICWGVKGRMEEQPSKALATFFLTSPYVLVDPTPSTHISPLSLNLENQIFFVAPYDPNSAPCHLYQWVRTMKLTFGLPNYLCKIIDRSLLPLWLQSPHLQHEGRWLNDNYAPAFKNPVKHSSLQLLILWQFTPVSSGKLRPTIL